MSGLDKPAIRPLRHCVCLDFLSGFWHDMVHVPWQRRGSALDEAGGFSGFFGLSFACSW